MDSCDEEDAHLKKDYRDFVGCSFSGEESQTNDHKKLTING